MALLRIDCLVLLLCTFNNSLIAICEILTISTHTCSELVRFISTMLGLRWTVILLQSLLLIHRLLLIAQTRIGLFLKHLLFVVRRYGSLLFCGDSLLFLFHSILLSYRQINQSSSFLQFLNPLVQIGLIEVSSGHRTKVLLLFFIIDASAVDILEVCLIHLEWKLQLLERLLRSIGIVRLLQTVYLLHPVNTNVAFLGQTCSCFAPLDVFFDQLTLLVYEVSAVDIFGGLRRTGLRVSQVLKVIHLYLMAKVFVSIA